MKRWIRIAGWIVVWATSVFFIQSGIEKLAGLGQMTDKFHDLGYPDWFLIVVGLFEVMGAVLLAAPRLTLYAAAALSVLMTGAIISEVIAGHIFEALLPGQWLIVFAIIIFLRFRSRNKTKSKQEGPRWLGFHHVAVVTSDLDATIHFYENVLGMQKGMVYPATLQRGRHCFVKPGDTKSWGIHFFEYADAQLFQSADALKRLAEDRESTELFRFIPGALQHIAFALPSEQDGMALRNKLHNHGIVMTDIYDQGSIRNFIFIDNNGVQLEAAWPKDIKEQE